MSMEPEGTWQHAVGLLDDDAPHTCTGYRRQKLRRTYHARLEPDRPVLVTKDPRSSLRVGLLGQVFSTARFIHILRDGRDTVSSLIIRMTKCCASWTRSNDHAVGD